MTTIERDYTIDRTVPLKLAKRFVRMSPGDIMRAKNCSYEKALEVQKLARIFLEKYETK